MISTSTRLRSNGNKPFLLIPVGKDYLWGGNRLNDDFSKGIDMKPLAETWECSTHPNGMSIVGSGEHAGELLKTVLSQSPEYLGTHSQKNAELPVLIKLIDAKENLSVQVHPDDDYANKVENGQKGKTEFWYVIDATKDAQIVYGFHHDCDRLTIEKSIENGTLEYYLQKIPVKQDDVFLIKSGTVHAIGAGTLVAEIQQCSDLTYRLYDYDRTDKNGKKRELHIEKALDVTNMKAASEPKQPMRVLKFSPGCAIELLERCQYFQVERMLINTERIREMVSFQTDELSFKVLLCIGGCGAISFEKERINIFKGDCIFVPSDSVNIKLHGKMQILSIGC